MTAYLADTNVIIRWVLPHDPSPEGAEDVPPLSGSEPGNPATAALTAGSEAWARGRTGPRGKGERGEPNSLLPRSLKLPPAPRSKRAPYSLLATHHPTPGPLSVPSPR